VLLNDAMLHLFMQFVFMLVDHFPALVKVDHFPALGCHDSGFQPGDRLCSTREPPQIFSANEFIGQPTTNFASQDLLCTLLTIAWGSGVGLMVCDAESLGWEASGSLESSPQSPAGS